MRKRREIPLFSISFLDLLSGALGAVIILYVAVPKNTIQSKDKGNEVLMSSLQKDLKKSQEELNQVKSELANARRVENVNHDSIHAQPESSEGERKDLDVGFKFKGKKIVFAIDTSQSMQDEDRMGQVKAGIKMLFTSLPPSYSIEVVQFPQGERAPFKSLFGTTRDADTSNKIDAFDFIYQMKPWGGTPTRDVLLFILENYDGISDIVLLSDGAPSIHNSNKKDDIYDILKAVREHNKHKVQISTIGVGSEFIKDKTSDRYKFLNSLAEENNGFFVGF